MTNFKRIISFVMAMVIFASFFCYNAGAITNPNYAFYLYSGNFVREYFSDTSAYAFARITNWAEETNTTDLRVSTYANSEDYDRLYDAAVYVNLTVELEDGSRNYANDIGYMDPEEVTVDAYIHGRECLNSEDHYSIEEFWSSHKVELFLNIYNYRGEIIGHEVVNDGPIIEIATTD